jgi:secreted trypsin-like serine protease
MNTRMIINTVAAITLVSLFVSCAPSTSNKDGQIATGDESQSNIIGGVNSSSDYQKQNGIVGLLLITQDRDGNQMSATCSGSLIAKNVVLTAAHCLTISADSEMMAALVFFDKNLDAIVDEVSNDDYSHVRAIDKVVRHEAYLQSRTTNNDIGLVRFDGQAPEGFQLAQMAPPEMIRSLRKGTSVTLAGFGVSKYVMNPATGRANGSGDGVLRQISGIKILSQTTTGEEITLDQSQGRGACHGDSGGPAYMLDSVSRKTLLVGVTSRGTDPQGLCNRQAIYTGVMGYTEWIANSLKKIAE